MKPHTKSGFSCPWLTSVAVGPSLSFYLKSQREFLNNFLFHKETSIINRPRWARLVFNCTFRYSYDIVLHATQWSSVIHAVHHIPITLFADSSLFFPLVVSLLCFLMRFRDISVWRSCSKGFSSIRKRLVTGFVSFCRHADIGKERRVGQFWLFATKVWTRIKMAHRIARASRKMPRSVCKEFDGARRGLLFLSLLYYFSFFFFVSLVFLCCVSLQASSAMVSKRYVPAALECPPLMGKRMWNGHIIVARLLISKRFFFEKRRV